MPHGAGAHRSGFYGGLVQQSESWGFHVRDDVDVREQRGFTTKVADEPASGASGGCVGDENEVGGEGGDGFGDGGGSGLRAGLRVREEEDAQTHEEGEWVSIWGPPLGDCLRDDEPFWHFRGHGGLGKQGWFRSSGNRSVVGARLGWHVYFVMWW